ncbi:hypothetical protein EGR_02386 [Echinococcus granulosus]|uniref:Uncharacterized protein n=1 Tax=Echinococcus granulosus TaxID=6210 RepID=W6UM19_ECHGR|nr:hypothetical protein EGR_02386 [Echinococcus granulosus]EUB62590.1 hypothetical protein EGR_02386 [Echinococcus granulosus]
MWFLQTLYRSSLHHHCQYPVKLIEHLFEFSNAENCREVHSLQVYTYFIIPFLPVKILLPVFPSVHGEGLDSQFVFMFKLWNSLQSLVDACTTLCPNDYALCMLCVINSHRSWPFEHEVVKIRCHQVSTEKIPHSPKDIFKITPSLLGSQLCEIMDSVKWYLRRNTAKVVDEVLQLIPGFVFGKILHFYSLNKCKHCDKKLCVFFHSIKQYGRERCIRSRIKIDSQILLRLFFILQSSLSRQANDDAFASGSVAWCWDLRESKAKLFLVHILGGGSQSPKSAVLATDWFSHTANFSHLKMGFGAVELLFKNIVRLSEYLFNQFFFADVLRMRNPSSVSSSSCAVNNGRNYGKCCKTKYLQRQKVNSFLYVSELFVKSDGAWWCGLVHLKQQYPPFSKKSYQSHNPSSSNQSKCCILKREASTALNFSGHDHSVLRMCLISSYDHSQTLGDIHREYTEYLLKNISLSTGPRLDKCASKVNKNRCSLFCKHTCPRNIAHLLLLLLENCLCQLDVPCFRNISIPAMDFLMSIMNLFSLDLGI